MSINIFVVFHYLQAEQYGAVIYQFRCQMKIPNWPELARTRQMITY